MKVLVACECSQVVCKAFRDKGHFAFSCDLQPSYGGHPEWHIIGDCLPLLKGNCTFTTEDGTTWKLPCTWDLIIAHPPCTYLSKAGANWLISIVNGERIINKEREAKMREAAEFFYKIIYTVPECTKLCIENPQPLKMANLPCPTQSIQPYYFGDKLRKYTYLWLYNDLMPLLCFTTTVPDGVVPIVSSSNNGLYSSPKLRSQTAPGIALAMANQWG